MSGAVPGRRRLRLTCFVIPFVVALVGRVLRGQTADPPRPLGQEESQRLEARAAELYQAGFQTYEQGDLAKSVTEFAQSLRTFEEIYPKEKFPQGHPDLANTLDAMGHSLLSEGSYLQAARVLGASASDAPVALSERSVLSGPPLPRPQP